jgi:hypothetical protein
MTDEEEIGRKVESRARQQGGLNMTMERGDGYSFCCILGSEKKDQDADGRSGKTTLKSPPGIRI